MIAPRRFLPSIPALQALEAVDRLGSATAAAEELSLTQSAVSRQLQALETQLGVGLLNRSRKRLGLTRTGTSYAAEIRNALQQIAQASLKVQANPGGGAVNLAILPTFGMRWLVPRLPHFAERHPDITINMTTRLEPFNFASQSFDAAIHYGDGTWPGAERMLLAHETVLPVALPELLADQNITQPSDLLRLPLLHIQTRPRAWHQWFAARGVDPGPVTGTFYDQFSTVMQAAMHGLGVALMPDFVTRQELADGRLAPAFGAPSDSVGSYWLVWPEDRATDAALTQFRNWLREEIEADPEDMLPR